MARTNPLLLLLVVAPAALIVGLAWAGWRGAAILVASSNGASTAVILAVGVVFAILGFNVQHVSSPDRALDAQIRAAPLSRLELFLSTVGIPFTICCFVVSISSLALFVPLVYAAGATPYATVQIALFEASIFYAAGAVGEVLKRVTRRQLAAVLALPPLILSWVGGGFVAGGGVWPGIVRPLGHAVLNTGTEPVLQLTSGLLLLLFASVGAWISLPALLWFRVPGSGFAAVFSVGLKRMGRNRSVRRHILFVALVAGTLSCLASSLLPDVAQVALGGVLLLAAVSVAIVPLATYGANRDSNWLWRSAPVSFATYVLGMVGAGFCAGILAVVVPATMATLPLLWIGGGLPELGTIAVIVMVTLLMATGVGFLVPCSLENTSEQVLSYAAFGASLAGFFAVGPWVAPRLVVLGFPESLVEVGLALAVAGLVITVASLREYERRNT